MIRLKHLTLLVFVMAASALKAQTDITASVTEAIKHSDASMLSNFFMSSIDLTIDDFDGTVSHDEAKGQVAQFFAGHQVKDFSIKHQGTSKLDDQYRIGELTTNQGVFRVTFFMRKSGNTLLIKQFKIEPA